MQEGRVKWFDKDRGFGFIRPNKRGLEDVFIHISDLEKSGYDDLEKGDVVEYEVEDGKKGERAINITIFDFV